MKGNGFIWKLRFALRKSLMGSRKFYYPGRNKQLHLRKYSTPASVNSMYFNAFSNLSIKKHQFKRWFCFFVVTRHWTLLVYLFFASMQYFGYTLLQVNAFNKIMLSAYHRRNYSHFLTALNNCTDQHHRMVLDITKPGQSSVKKDSFCATI